MYQFCLIKKKKTVDPYVLLEYLKVMLREMIRHDDF